MLSIYRIEHRFASTKPYWVMLAATFATATLSLPFFRLVGLGQIDRLGPVVCDLATAVTCAIVTACCSIGSSAIYPRDIIPSYCGEGRIITYSWPGGRTPLFTVKSMRVWFGTFLSVGGGLLAPLAVYAMLVGDKDRLTMLVTMTVETYAVAGLSASIGVISGAIGLAKGSGVAAVVSAIILGCLAANGFANSDAQAWSVIIAIAMCAVLSATAIFATIHRQQRIAIEDVL